MAFKLYTDKSSVRKKNSRYVQGGIPEIEGNFIKWWERIELAKDDVTDLTYTISEVYAKKPDLIAYDMYRRNDLGWLVLQYNNIVDINEELDTGKVILLPSSDRVFFELLSKTSSVRRVT